MNKTLKYSNILLPAIFWILIFWFFEFRYAYHLHYQEQLQMFLFTSDYFDDLVSCPGGIVNYLGTFFTQFFYYSWIGAIIIASLLVVLQQQLYFLMKKINSPTSHFALTFVPPILYWALLCNESYMIAGVVALVIILFSVQLYLLCHKKIRRLVIGILFIPLLYWFVGGIFWLFAIVVIFYETIILKEYTKSQRYIYSFIMLTLVASLPFLSHYFLQYPIDRLWWGLPYIRFPIFSQIPLLLVWLSVPASFLIIYLFPNKNLKNNGLAFLYITECVLLFIAASWYVNYSVDNSKEEIMAYDYNVRQANWSRIIEMANRKTPKSPLSVACLNLALCEEGKLGDTMFRYYQNGTEGLLPTFQRDFTSPLITNEIYFHLGFLNTSMHYAFESMEAIPDYKKSARAIQRIAEINMLNGEIAVARKYLHLLQHTLFYRKWAENALQCVGNNAMIDKNKEWAMLRKFRMTNDILFSEEQKDQMLGLLFMHCPQNRMAFEYLIAYMLLNKDLNHFLAYMPLGKDLGYREMPTHYQEALLAYWASTGKSWNEMPWRINPAIGSAFNDYMQAMSYTHGDEEQMSGRFSQTYWYYLQYRK